jgi:hypothetical protein
MTDQIRSSPGGGAAEKLRVLRARSLFGDLAGRMADRDRARHLEAELNDAWLGLQLALVTDDPSLAQAQRRACAVLMDEALDGSGPRRRPEPG